MTDGIPQHQIQVTRKSFGRHGNHTHHYGVGRGGVNLQRYLHARQYNRVSGDAIKRYCLQRGMVKKLTAYKILEDESYTGPMTVVRWSADGQTLLSCGNNLTLHSYPEYSALASAHMPSEVFDAEFLNSRTVLTGTSNGAIVLSHLPHLQRTSDHGASLQGQSFIRCHSGSVFSVKPLVGMNEDVFYTASADRTVRLFDTRALCTCTSSRACSSNILLNGNTSYRALAVNPANPYQFCVSHGPFLGVHDLRLCCSESDRSLLQRYDIPPSSRYYGNRFHSWNRVSHAVYNSSGTEILVNTRTVGALLISTRCHDNETGYHDNNTSARDNSSSSRDCIVVCEDVESGAITDAQGSLRQLGGEITNWLNERCPTNRSGTEGEQDNESERRNDRESRSERECGGIIARYTGHRNTRTVLKEAAFWDDQYILSGSDCGRVFVWDRSTRRVLAALQTDPQTAISVRPHPYDPTLACCGLNRNVQIWGPHLDVSLIVLKRFKHVISETFSGAQITNNP